MCAGLPGLQQVPPDQTSYQFAKPPPPAADAAGHADDAWGDAFDAFAEIQNAELYVIFREYVMREDVMPTASPCATRPRRPRRRSCRLATSARAGAMTSLRAINIFREKCYFS